MGAQDRPQATEGDRFRPGWRCLLALAVCALGAILPGQAFGASLITGFEGGVLVDTNTSNPQPSDYATQAGSHPDVAFTDFTLNTSSFASAKDVRIDLPPGLSVDPQAIPQCNDPEANGATLTTVCPADSEVGTASVDIANVPFLGTVSASGNVYNMVPTAGEPGHFAFQVTIAGLITVRTDMDAGLRYYPSNGQPADYGEYFTISNISNTLGTSLASSDMTFWGAPEEHNGAGAPDNAFLTDPTACDGPETTEMYADTYTSGQTGTTSFTTPVGASGCSSVPFAPTVTVTPSTTQRDASDGIAVDIHVPQDENPADLASSQLQDASVTLPAGLTLNPAAASALQTCTDAQFAAGTSSQDDCPTGSAIGTAEIDTPSLAAPLTGSIYLGVPLADDPYRIFVDVGNPATSGVRVRIVGTVSANPSTGQLTATFTDAPQLPFTDFKLSFDSGADALFANPDTCGSATTTASLTPYSGNAAASPTSSFTVDEDGAGGACPTTTPFAPTFTATPTTTAAGALDSLTLGFASGSAQQDLGSITAVLPAGLLGSIASVPACAEPAATDGTCGSSSQIGTATVEAGIGSTPLTLSGPVYLTGPYDGAPFGLSIVIPASAGPYDFGTVVTRAAISVDPNDAHLTITSAALPSIVGGVPLRLSGIQVAIARSGGFLFNPTSCATQDVSATIGSVAGASAPAQVAFTPTGCGALGFSPALSASASGGTNGVALGVTVTPKAGQANLQSVSMRLPKELAVRQSTLDGACAAASYAANPATCPAVSRVGSATAASSILPATLTGSAYLVAHSGGLPTLDLALTGDGVTIDLSGSFGVTSDGLVTTFSSIPDVPLSSFSLSLAGGSSSALVTSDALSCSGLSVAAALIGQNGAQQSSTVPLGVSGCATTSSTSSSSSAPALSWLHIAIPRLRHLRHHVLRLELVLPSSGKITLSARDIHTVSAWTPKKGRSVWVTLRLTRYGLRQMGHHRRLTVKMRATFHARTGRSGWVPKQATFL